MPGRAAIDQVCAHEASQGIMLAQLLTSTHILEVFVHENEEDDPALLAEVCVDRARKHARNAYWMLYEPEQLTRNAGRGVRQGYADAGPLVDSSPAERAGQVRVRPGVCRGRTGDPLVTDETGGRMTVPTRPS